MCRVCSVSAHRVLIRPFFMRCVAHNGFMGGGCVTHKGKETDTGRVSKHHQECFETTQGVCRNDTGRFFPPRPHPRRCAAHSRLEGLFFKPIASNQFLQTNFFQNVEVPGREGTLPPEDLEGTFTLSVKRGRATGKSQSTKERNPPKKTRTLRLLGTG